MFIYRYSLFEGQEPMIGVGSCRKGKVFHTPMMHISDYASIRATNSGRRNSG